MALRVLVRGVGDIGSAVAHRLFLAAHVVVIHDALQPTTTRRGMAFADAIFVGRATLDGVAAVRVDHPEAVPALLADRAVVLDRRGFRAAVTARISCERARLPGQHGC